MNFFKSLFGLGQQTQQVHKINGNEYHELNLIAEGGYGYVWRAIDTKRREMCVIKKMLCQSKEVFEQARQEVTLHKALNHQNIVRVLNYDIIKAQNNHHEIILVLEICEGGTLLNLLERYRDQKLTEKQVLAVLKQIVQGIKYLHSQNPPIQHRDLKIENILFHNKIFKICDFGSASTQQIDFTKLSKIEISRCEEHFSKYTTEMYRPPEMTDTYLNYPVTEKVDIWMLGCILYSICFYRHPFEEASKVAIVEGSFIIPENNYSDKMIDLIRLLLTPDPSQRPSIFKVEEILSNYETLERIPLSDSVQHTKLIEEQFKQAAQNEEEFDEFQAPEPINDQLL